MCVSPGQFSRCRHPHELGESCGEAQRIDYFCQSEWNRLDVCERVPEQLPALAGICAPETVEPFARRSDAKCAAKPVCDTAEWSGPFLLYLCWQRRILGLEHEVLEPEEFCKETSYVAHVAPHFAHTIPTVRKVRSSRPAVTVRPYPVKAGEHGAGPLRYHRPAVPEVIDEKVEPRRARETPPERGEHMRDTVELPPCAPVGREPLGTGHQRMLKNGVEGILLIEVRIDYSACCHHARVVLAPGDRCEDKERRLIDAERFQSFHVVRHGCRRVGGKSDDVARVHGDAVIVARAQHVFVLSDVILSLPDSQ